MILVKGKWVSADKYTQHRGATRAYMTRKISETPKIKTEVDDQIGRDLITAACLFAFALVIFVFDCTLKGPVLGTDPWGVMKWRLRCKW
jgi:hypothetical protein